MHVPGLTSRRNRLPVAPANLEAGYNNIVASLLVTVISRKGSNYKKPASVTRGSIIVIDSGYVHATAPYHCSSHT
jgi:hypothetical protein